MKNTVSIIAAIFLLQGCFDDFEQPRVVEVFPAHNSMSVSSDTVIIVDFSTGMDTVRTNNEFILSSETRGRIDGFFAWENADTRMIFTPREPLLSEAYNIRITTDAEDKKGNDIKNEYVSVFYVNSDFDILHVRSFVPEANSIGNRADSTVVIEFSRAVDLNTIYEGIQITPYVQGTLMPDADRKIITFQPLYGFNYGVTYTVKVNPSLLDESGKKHAGEVAWNFTVGDDFEKPSLVLYQNNIVPLYFETDSLVIGAEKNIPLVVEFSEQVKTADIFRAVSISPSVPFYVTASIVEGVKPYTRAVINFIENLAGEETYTLNISPVITDLQGNSLDREYRFRFATNGPGSIAPCVVSIGDTEGIDWIFGEVYPFTLEYVNLSNIIRVDFSAPVDPVTLAISVSRAAGSGGGGIAAIADIDWSSDFTRLTFRMSGVTSGNVYKLVIKGGSRGLYDLRENFMKEDFVQLVRF